MRALLDAFARRDFDAALESVRDDVRWRPFLNVEADVLDGKAAVRRAWDNNIEALNVHIEPQALIPVGEDQVVAAVRFVARGSHSALPLEREVAQLFRFNGGQIVSVESHDSRGEALAAAAATRSAS